MLAVTSSTGLKVHGLRHHSRLLPITFFSTPLSPLAAFFVARPSLLSMSTTIVGVTSSPSSEVLSWTYHSATHTLTLGSRKSLLLPSDTPIAHVVPVPPRRSTEQEVEIAATAMLVVDQRGALTFWTASIPDSAYEWKKGPSVRTGKEGIVMVACSAEAMTAIGASLYRGIGVARVDRLTRQALYSGSEWRGKV